MAVHGLAYLGVALLFTAALGFLLFAFAGVNPVAKPLAEAAIPATLFGAARLLRDRGAPLVTEGLTLAGGAVLPVVGLTAFVDGSPLPPDLAGLPLVVAWTAVTAAVAAGCAVADRRSGSVLGRLAAPTAWLSAACASLAATGVVTAVQPAVVAAAAAGTAVVVAATGRAARSTLPVAAATALGGLVVTLLVAAGNGWPPVPAVAAGVATLVALDVAARSRAGWRAAFVPVGLVVTSACAWATATVWGTAWAGVVATIACIALLERGALRPGRGALEAVAVAAVGALGLLAVASEAALAVVGLDAATAAAPAVVGWGAAAAWGHARMLLQRDARGFRRWLPATAAAVLPAGALVAATALTSVLVAAAAAAVAAVTALCAPRARGFYSWWAPAGATFAIALATVGETFGAVAAGEVAVVAAVAALVVVRAAGPSPALRVWWAAGPALLAATAATRALGWSEPVTLAALGVLGAAACLPVAVSTRSPAAHLAVVGRLLLLGVAIDAVEAPAAVSAAAVPATAAALLVGWLLSAAARRSTFALEGVVAAVYAAAVLNDPDVAAGTMGAAWAVAGVAMLAAAVGRRAAGRAVSGAAVVVGAAYAAGAWPWPLAAAAATLAAGAGAAAWRADAGGARAAVPLWAASAGLTAVAWGSLLFAVEVSAATGFSATAVAGGLVAAAAGGASRGGLSREATAIWLALATVGLSAAVTAGTVVDLDTGALAAGLAAAAVGAAAAAAPLREPLLRDVAGSLTVLSTTAAAGALGLSLGQRTALGVTRTTLAAAGGLALWRSRSESPWLSPLSRIGAAAALGAVLTGFAAGGWAPTVALLAVAVQTAAVAAVTGRAAIALASPVAAGLAWLTAAELTDVTGTAVAIPLGAALLAEVDVARAARADTTTDQTASAWRTVDVAGIATAATPALLHLLVGEVSWVFAAVGVAAGLLVWGCASRSRRRVWAAAVTTLAALTLVVAVPTLRLLPQVEGVWLWVALAAVGAALLAGATGLERGRTATLGAVRRVDALMAGWN